MIQSLLSSIRLQTSNDPVPSRRQHTRRESERCVAVIDNQVHPVVNWSLGGLLVDTDHRFMPEGETLNVQLKFKLRSKILSIPLQARVIRSRNNRVAMQFVTVPLPIQRAFQQVVDDTIAREFARSQSYT